MSADKMAAYLRQVKEVEAKEVDATWRKSPLFVPLSFTMIQPPCGCTIEGDGNLPSPLRIKFCTMHARAR